MTTSTNERSDNTASMNFLFRVMCLFISWAVSLICLQRMNHSQLSKAHSPHPRVSYTED